MRKHQRERKAGFSLSLCVIPYYGMVKYALSFLVLIVLLLAPSQVLAVDPPTPTPCPAIPSTAGKPPITQQGTDLGCIPSDPALFVGKFYSIGLSLIGGVAVLFIIFGGYTLITSQGNPIQINKGKSYIFYAIVGLLLAIFGYVFVEVIAVDILKIPGFN